MPARWSECSLLPTERLRAELLALNGIGPETADSILLYGGSHEIFVVDAYTRRILERHEAITSDAKYDEIRRLVEQALRREQISAPSSRPPVLPLAPAASSFALCP